MFAELGPSPLKRPALGRLPLCFMHARRLFTFKYYQGTRNVPQEFYLVEGEADSFHRVSEDAFSSCLYWKALVHDGALVDDALAAPPQLLTVVYVTLVKRLQMNTMLQTQVMFLEFCEDKIQGHSRTFQGQNISFNDFFHEQNKKNSRAK